VKREAKIHIITESRKRDDVAWHVDT